MIQATNTTQKYKQKLVFVVILFCQSLAPTFVAAATAIPTKNIEYLFSIKGHGSKPLSLPSDVAVADDGNIYIVDSGNHRVAVFNEDGDSVSYISGKGSQQNEMMNPLGIDVAGNNIFVADKDNHRIQVFDTNGSYKDSISIREGGELIRPVDIAVNTDSRLIYVTGNNNHKVMAYDYTGNLLRQWGGEGTNNGELRFPATISLYDKKIYVVDVLNSRVQVFNSQGELETIVGEWGVLPGQLFRPKGVAHDTKGNVYVGDSYLGVIQVFSTDTRFQYVLGKADAPYKFTSPAGIAIDKHNRLYVCEMLGNKVSVFQLNP